MLIQKISDRTSVLTLSSIINNTTSTSTIDSLSANQGKVLNDKIDGTVLWTNSSNNVAFAGQAVTVTDMTPYSRYTVWFRHYAGYNFVVHADALVGFGGYGAEIDESGNRNMRMFTYTNSTTITFGNGEANDVTDNSRLIPIKIIGYKY